MKIEIMKIRENGLVITKPVEQPKPFDLQAVVSKYTVDCFTLKSLGSKFPENSYFVETTGEVERIISNCTRKISGIVQVQVWINKPDERSAY